MDNNKIKAIIVSDIYDHCRFFLKHYNLNPKQYGLITRAEQAMAIRRDMKVIITHHSNDFFNSDLYQLVTHRFSNIKFVNY